MKYLNVSDKIAVVDRGRDISFSELITETSFFAHLIEDVDSERIAIFSENRAEWVMSFYSCWRAEKTAVPIDYLSTPEEVQYILEDCKPGAIFCSQSQHDIIAHVLQGLSYPIKTIIYEEIPEKVGARVGTDTGTSAEFPDCPAEKTAMIIYTSGTTGSPKGVMLSFKNLNINVEACAQTGIFAEDTIVLGLLPLHHTFPLMGCMVGPLAVGGKLVICPSMASEVIIDTLQTYKINTILAVPRFYNLIRKGIRDKINASAVAKVLFRVAEKLNSPKFSKKIFKKVHDRFGGNVRFMICGGAAIDFDVAKDYQTLGFEMLEGYGMTECAPMISFTRPGRRRLGSGGEVLMGTEVETRDGEIVTRGDHVMQGYFNRPEETAEVIKDGWLHTGDVGEVDSDGFVFIRGRKKEIVVLSNGKNINPVEVEMAIEAETLYTQEVGVFESNDQLHAIIFPDFPRLESDEMHQIEEHFTEVVGRYNQSVSSYKKVSTFTITKEELPKTRLGKIRRFMLKDLLQKTGRNGDASSTEEEPDCQTYQVIKAYLSTQTDHTVHPSDHLEIDLGLDSLDKVNFHSFLENTFGIELEENIFSKHPSLRSLSKFVADNKKRISEESINWGKILKQKLDLTLPRVWVTHFGFKYVYKAAFNLYFRFKSEGVNKIPEGPCIIAPNHQSYFDGFFICSILRNFQLKKTYFYAKEKHLKRWWLKFLANRHNVIVMDINKDLKTSLQKMAEALKRGKNIIIFPEGTRTRDGKVGNFKKTFAILSRELNVPVVPVSIKGAFEALPRGGRIPKLGKQIFVRFSDPVYPEDHTYDSLKEKVYNDVSKHVDSDENAA